MFWSKRTTHKFPLVVFGLIALGIIISTTVLVVELYQEKKVVELKDKSDNFIDHTNSLEIDYFSEISQLLNTVNESTSIDEAVNPAKNIFLNVRVPSEMRSSHLAVFLQLIKIEDAKDTFTLDQVKDNISSLLQSILENK